jgi:hypothetical protein
MSIQTAFQTMLEELYAISPYLNFRLPKSAKSVDQQVEKLLLVEQRLCCLEEKVIQRFSLGGSPCARQAYQTLINLTEQMRLAAVHLRLLTEEHLIDPEGTQACFQTEVVRHSELLNQIKSLKVVRLTHKCIANS